MLKLMLSFHQKEAIDFVILVRMMAVRNARAIQAAANGDFFDSDLEDGW